MVVALFQAAYSFVVANPLIVFFVLFVAYQKYKSSLPFPESGGRVKSIHSEDEWSTAKASGKPFVVDFYATWCPPCRAIAPVYGEISTAFPAVEFYKVNVDEVRSVAQECGIRAMPTFKLFKGGVEVAQVQGANRGMIVDMLENAGLGASPSASAGPGEDKAD